MRMMVGVMSLAWMVNNGVLVISIGYCLSDSLILIRTARMFFLQTVIHLHGQADRRGGDGMEIETLATRKRSPGNVFVKFPTELLETLKQRAAQEHRSLSQQIRHLTEIGLRTEDERSCPTQP
jgi:hypothetical protein